MRIYAKTLIGQSVEVDVESKDTIATTTLKVNLYWELKVIFSRIDSDKANRIISDIVGLKEPQKVLAYLTETQGENNYDNIIQLLISNGAENPNTRVKIYFSKPFSSETTLEECGVTKASTLRIVVNSNPLNHVDLPGHDPRFLSSKEAGTQGMHVGRDASTPAPKSS
jgi:hypothetical protein